MGCPHCDDGKCTKHCKQYKKCKDRKRKKKKKKK